MTDFEVAIQNAFLTVVPDAEATSCLFHFKQAVKRKARKFGEMMKFIMSNAQARHLYFKLMSLPLLPADRIANMFDQLKDAALELQTAEGMGNIFDGFLRYYFKQWIEGGHVSIIVYFSNSMGFFYKMKY